MRTMYKEEVSKRKLPVVLGIFLMLPVAILISDLIERIKIADRSIGAVTNPVFVVLITALAVFEIIKCREKYRYSIIADQLIVHKIVNGEHQIEENIKLKDIEYIGKTCSLVSRLDMITNKHHVCSLLKSGTYYCIYRNGDKTKKFYFQPSTEFVSKIQYLIQNEKKVS